MERIASFEQFKNNETPEIVNDEDVLSATNESSSDDRKHYMFFRNLISAKHNIDEILGMDPDKIDDLLENGHDWAADHISTSKDDILEVTEWLRGEFDESLEGEESEEGEMEDEDETEEDETEEDETEDEDETEEDETEEDEMEDEDETEDDDDTTKQPI